MSQQHQLPLAGLLHDIGKFRQRTQRRLSGPHEQHSYQFVTEDAGDFFQPLGAEMAEAILQHHGSHRTELEKQLVLSDWLSAKEREVENREREQPAHTPLVSIMTRIEMDGKKADQQLRYELGPLRIGGEGVIPQVEARAHPDLYAQLWAVFLDEFKTWVGDRSYQPEDFQTLQALIHKYTLRMPSATPWETGSESRTIPDVSLYDHLRTTAAIATCVGAELDLASTRQLLADVNKKADERKLADREIAVLIKGDLSGIQNFLYQVKSEGAARSLRGRSFYVQLLTEAVSHWLLRQLELPMANLLMASGGHFFLLAPPQKARQIHQLQQQLSRKLWQIHRDELSIGLGQVTVRAGDFDHFSPKWRDVSTQVQSVKQRKWQELGSEQMFELLFNSSQEISIDFDFQNLGRQLRQARYLMVFETEEQEAPVSPTFTWQDTFLSFGWDVQLLAQIEAGMQPPEMAQRAVVYTLQAEDDGQIDFLNPALLQQTRWSIPVSYDFRLLPQVIPTRPGRQETADYQQLAEAATGASWLGVLRMDVDNLGQLFRQGLNPDPEDREDNRATISRVITLSETMRLFFEGYVPRLCREFNQGNRSINRQTDILELIYAGGDDLCLVGGWSALPLIARQIRDAFSDWVNGGQLTLSAGIAIEHSKFPLYQLAARAGSALDEAKEGRAEKDAISFLQQSVAWDKFDRVEEWQERLVSAVEARRPLPRGFITRLSEIARLHQRDPQRGKWAWQLVYHLSQAEQRNRDQQPLIRELRENLIAVDGNPPELITWLATIARWATLLIRAGERDEETR